VPPPPTMVSPDTTCVLAGDCCHSLLPFLGQGLSLGLEDAATLGQLLSHVKAISQMPKAVAMYDRLRTERARKIDHETGLQVNKLHLFYGGLQKEQTEAGNTSVKSYDV
jgi:salicylate hydroxylase